MHHIHHSEAFILGSRPKGEDSKLLILYTRELGLIYAHAQGVRKISSKLRYVVQDFSHVQVDLVRGKEIWRLTTASPIRSYRDLLIVRPAERILARMASLLMRLVPGEEASEEVYQTLVRAYALLEVHGQSAEDYRALELLSVARILVALGYLSRATPGIVHEDAEGAHMPQEFSDIAYQHRLIRDINQALAATQL
jgi:DNA repair protein RecO